MDNFIQSKGQNSSTQFQSQTSRNLPIKKSSSTSKNLLTQITSPILQNSPIKPSLLTDQNLYFLCKTYGARALELRRKFTGLLPEVFKRKLYEKKGFESIFVFAKKLAGLSEEQVRLVLNLETRFKELPDLHGLLVNGEVSVNKLARVASIANSENQKFLADQIRILSNSAVETLVRDERWTRNNEEMVNANFSGVGKNQNGLFEPENEAKSLHVQTFTQLNLPKSNSQKLSLNANLYKSDTLRFSPEVHQRLLELQQKGIDLNALLLEFLQKRELEIAEKKKEISKKVLQKEKEKRMAESEEISEYLLEKPDFLKSRPSIPVAARKIIHEEFGTKCAVNSCQKRAENIHHTLPFAIGRSNDPKFLVPLCKQHHELEHVVNRRYVGARAGA